MVVNATEEVPASWRGQIGRETNGKIVGKDRIIMMSW
jgi:hypothetical protein